MNCRNDPNIPNIREVHLLTGYDVGQQSPYTEVSPRQRKSESFSGAKVGKLVKDIVEAEIDEIVEIENVTVKFHIAASHVIAQVYPNRMTIGDVKKDIARKFEVNPELLRLTQCKDEWQDECMIMQTCSDEFGIYNFDLELALDDLDIEDVDGDLPTLDLEIYYNKHRLPDFITVHIAAEDTADGNPKEIIVEIQNKAIVKPFLCGYKDKATGTEYLNAFTQTGPYFDKWKHRRYISRDTQTFEHKVKLIDTMHEQSSQCFLDGNNVRFVSTATDFTIVPRKYQTYAQKMRIENKLAKIILIQRNWRRYWAVRFMRNAAKEYRRLVANRLEAEQKAKEEAEKRIARETRAKQFPRTKDDFDLLYAEVQKWKMAELKRITGLYDGAARIAEVSILLDKEIQLLNNIERQRQLVFKAMQDFREEQLLKEMGKPIEWIGYKDKTIHLDLIRTQRVRFLSEVYKDLHKTLEKEERLTLLQKVKEILINEETFPEFPELFDLIQREINLLLYTKHCDVDILRKRQNILFLELIKYSKDGAEPKKKGQRLCDVCKQVKPYEQFAVRTRQNRVDTCQKCFYLKMASTENVIYVSILRAIQRDERKKRCNASFAFIMQVDDVRHIIDQIWHGHSILSKYDGKISDLRLPRWIKSDDWSPWNCVCLTEAEARDHYRVEDLEKIYDKKMILEVGNRHKLARRAFQRLAAVGTGFVETGQWFKVGLNKQRNADDIRVDSHGMKFPTLTKACEKK